MRGHLSEGRDWLVRLLALPEAPKLPAAQVKALNAAGYLAIIQGDASAAYPLLEISLTLARKLGDVACLTESLNTLGFAALAAGDYERAARLLEEGLACAQETADETACYVALFNLARVAQALGDHDRAVALHEESLALKRKRGDAWSTALSLSNLGHLNQIRGRHLQANALFQESLALRRRMGDKAGILLSFIGLAGVAAARGQAQRAARLLGAAEAQRSAIGFILPAPDRIDADRILASVRSVLGPAAFDNAWTAGRAMLLEEAAAFALAAGATVPAAPPRAAAMVCPDGLSARELDVLRLLAEGRTNKEIAAELVLSVRTVENHHASIYDKTGARGRAGLVAYALDHALTPHQRARGRSTPLL